MTISSGVSSPFSISGNNSPSRVDVGLAHLKTEPLIEGITKQEAMDKARIHAGHAHHPAPSNSSNTLTQRFTAAALNFKVAEDGFRGAAFGFKPHGINDGIHAALACGLLNDFSAASLSSSKLMGMAP